MSTLAAVASANEDRYRDPRTSPIIAAAIEVHRYLGPGLLESAYEECLCHELHLTGLSQKTGASACHLQRSSTRLRISD